MHPSHRYSFRYSYRYTEVGLNTNPCTLQSRISTRSASTQPPNLDSTRLDSTRMAPVSARSFHLPFFTLDLVLTRSTSGKLSTLPSDSYLLVSSLATSTVSSLTTSTEPSLAPWPKASSSSKSVSDPNKTSRLTTEPATRKALCLNNITIRTRHPLPRLISTYDEKPKP